MDKHEEKEKAQDQPGDEEYILTMQDLYEFFEHYIADIKVIDDQDGGQCLTFTFEGIDVCIHLGDKNYVEASRVYPISDERLRLCDSVSIYMSLRREGEKVVAKAYFTKNDCPVTVDCITNRLCSFFLEERKPLRNKQARRF